MTIDEAIEQFKYDAECNRADLDLSFAEDNDKVAEWLEELKAYQSIGAPEELQDMKNNYFEALSDWRQYRKIGTLEECRAAVEKQTAISREIIEGNYVCPKCHNLMPYPGYCGCGQRLY